MNDMNETNPIRAYHDYCCVDLENETKRETQFATPVRGPKIGRHTLTKAQDLGNLCRERARHAPQESPFTELVRVAASQ